MSGNIIGPPFHFSTSMVTIYTLRKKYKNILMLVFNSSLYHCFHNKLNTDIVIVHLKYRQMARHFLLCAKDYGTARGQTNQSYKMAKEENLGKRLHR